MKKVLVICSAYTPVIDVIKYRLNDIAHIDCITEQYFDEKLCNKYDLIVLSGIQKYFDINALSVRHSLDLNFEEENPVLESIKKGLKVTGITIFYTKTNKIISQYPIFIHNDTHYDDLVKELNYLEQTLFPIVIEKVIKNEYFETQDLLNSKTKCGGCGKCLH